MQRQAWLGLAQSMKWRSEGGVQSTSWAEMVLVRVLKLSLVQQLVQADNLLVVQLPRQRVLVDSAAHLRYQPPCITK